MIEPDKLMTALTYDDVMLVPQKSDVLPKETDVSTYLTPSLKLNVPILSAAMDTVTEARLAIALAQEGGLGIIHKNCTIAEQAGEVDKVKRSEAGMIKDPITLSPDKTVADALDIMKRYHISGIPIVKDGRQLVGIVTNRDLRFVKKNDLRLSEVMTKDDLVTVPVGTNLDKAEETLHKHRIEKLLVVDKKGTLQGLITIKDINKRIKFPNACKDPNGRLRVGAAVSVSKETEERAEALVTAGVDVVVVDTAARPFPGCAEYREDPSQKISQAGFDRGQHCDAGSREIAGGRGGRLREGGRGARLHLYHPGGDGRRGAPGLGYHRVREGGQEKQDHPDR